MNVFYTYLVVIVGAILIYMACRRIVINESERGVQYRNGLFKRILPPGMHWYVPFLSTVTKLDVRPTTVSISGQEILSADHVGLKVSLAVRYVITDPHRAILSTQNYLDALHVLIQIHLRAVICAMPIEDVLTNRQQIDEQLLALSTAEAEALGLQVQAIHVKDITFPGDLKRIFARVVEARQEGLAALEKARGESAALRNLANAAKMLDNNPSLLQLRALLAVEEQAGGTVVFNATPIEPHLARPRGEGEAK